MSDGERDALIIQPTRALDQPSLGAQRVLFRVIADALIIAKQRDVIESRIQFEGCEFREQDYRQLLSWAEAAQMRPGEFIGVLRKAGNVFWDGICFVVKDGAITQVAFPPDVFKTTIDLSNVPCLTRLNCSYNNLQVLDLSKIPKLSELYCEGNKLSDIDLSYVPNLEILCCGGNALTSINLTNLPELITLSCGSNKIKSLALPSKLLKLSCMRNEIQKLDLRPAPRVDFLDCDSHVDIVPAQKVLELMRYDSLQRY